MPSHSVTGIRPRRDVCVMVRLESAGLAERRASIELWTPAGTAPTPAPAAGSDLARVLRQASDLSDELGLHRSYAFIDQPDDVAASLRSWVEKRAALDELRAQRALLESEVSVGAHRADGSRRTEGDRADAKAMLLRLSVLRASILRQGFAIGASDDGVMPRT